MSHIAIYFKNIEINISVKKKDSWEIVGEISEENKYEMIDYDLFWNVIISEDKEHISAALKDFAINCLVNATIKDSELVNNYLLKASNEILKNKPYLIEMFKTFRKLSIMFIKTYPKHQLPIDAEMILQIIKSLIEYKILIGKEVKEKNITDIMKFVNYITI